ncbi:YbgA family protein [Parahaliea mediterranea]|uniref:DUF1722 domain-containing protein n=1 Tax=Parahaliea mediterranea TaxID=651086 RepID=A0A939ILI1_9GAMM|nr:DUF1722 domain-containing protein [Parahaliea mediterranea]MBN7798421.1 DUF1722 domain-containing protein [Parahaliea mediterranea]
MHQHATQPPRPVIGIGACLAGQEVRYNAQSKSPNSHVRALTEAFDVRPFCPEVGIGMGIPRPPIHLVGSDGGAVRALDVESHSRDYTEPLANYAHTVLARAPRLCGYILVKGSPSCGYDRVKRFADNGYSVASDTRGIFASALAAADPLLPLEDDGRLNDPGLRESFVSRVYTYHDWRALCDAGLGARALVDFYSRYKYLVMAHHVPSYKALGRMLADAGKRDIDLLAQEFIHTLMAALTERATQRSHSNVLFHLSGYLKRQLSNDERQRLKDLIDQYRVGELPLIVPVTLLKHHFANNPNPYIDQQVFMAPYPDHLRLRNHL